MCNNEDLAARQKKAKEIINYGERIDPALLDLLGWVEKAHIPRYEFAKKHISKADSVLDIACGTGYGSAMMAGGCKKVVGVDYSPIAIEYAKANYSTGNTEFILSDFLSNTVTADVVVSFETIEHIKANQFQQVLNKLVSFATHKIIASTPYREAEKANRFHYFSNLDENSFNSIKNIGYLEFFYQTADGVIHSEKPKIGKLQNLIFVLEKK